MGSNIKSTMFAPGALKELFQVFAEFTGMRVLFKGEPANAAELLSVSNNTLIRAWLPQQAVLSHPNTKVFVTHGGLLSITESIYHGVPVIGIPVFGDQSMNMQHAEHIGYGVKIDWPTLGADTVRQALNQVLNDPHYDRVAKAVSTRYRDQINPPLETAIYWVEYVARHRGCEHLRLSSIDFPFWKLYNLDVSAFIVLLALAPFIVARRLWMKICSSTKQKVKSKPKTN